MPLLAGAPDEEGLGPGGGGSQALVAATGLAGLLALGVAALGLALLVEGADAELEHVGATKDILDLLADVAEATVRLAVLIVHQLVDEAALVVVVGLHVEDGHGEGQEDERYVQFVHGCWL